MSDTACSVSGRRAFPNQCRKQERALALFFRNIAARGTYFARFAAIYGGAEQPRFSKSTKVYVVV